jgi:hypothetical protein
MKNTAGVLFALWLCVGLHVHVAFDHTELAHVLLGQRAESGEHAGEHHADHAPRLQRSEIHCVCTQGPIHEHGAPHAHSFEALTASSSQRALQPLVAEEPASLSDIADTDTAASLNLHIAAPISPFVAAPTRPRAPPLA